MSKLLIVDDEPSICWGLSRLAERLGHKAAVASSAEQGLVMLHDGCPDAIILDVRLPGMDGLAAMRQLRERCPQAPIILITAYGDLATAVEAVRGGAFEYLIKPFDLDKVERVLDRALASRSPSLPPAVPPAEATLLGRSPAMQEVFKRIALATSSHASVLLCGESGVGKELAARALHRHSGRADQPFVAVNVAALSPALAESELFGHVRGAFTGAERERAGLLAQANGGALFLDEVADIPLPVQIKLLRALEQGEVLPVGSNQPVKTDFRVISATHQDLLILADQGRFRHDLYFRLAAFRIDLPPLRQRRDDILPLAEHFLVLANASNRSAASLSDECRAELERRPWHGNVRELRNAIEHAVIVARRGVVDAEHLPPPAPPVGHSSAPRGIMEGASLEESIVELLRRWTRGRLASPEPLQSLYEDVLRLIEPPLLAEVLQKHHGQCAGAARVLGLHRTTLRKKLDQRGLEGQ